MPHPDNQKEYAFWSIVHLISLKNTDFNALTIVAKDL